MSWCVCVFVCVCVWVWVCLCDVVVVLAFINQCLWCHGSGAESAGKTTLVQALVEHTTGEAGGPARRILRNRSRVSLSFRRILLKKKCVCERGRKCVIMHIFYVSQN